MLLHISKYLYSEWMEENFHFEYLKSVYSEIMIICLLEHNSMRGRISLDKKSGSKSQTKKGDL